MHGGLFGSLGCWENWVKRGLGEVVSGRKHWRGGGERGKMKDEREKDNAETQRALRFAEKSKDEGRKDEAEMRAALRFAERWVGGLTP